ncbi:MAG: hypothetical protein KGZ81_04225 [Flavobacteriales bacterium]|nr:hypothetical protein [Flavobacteriales bacterium]
MKKKVLILTLLLFATGLFWHCSEEIHDNAVTFGVKHKKPQIKYLKGAEAKLVMNQLEKKVSKSKLRILGKAGTYARSNEGTIDYSEIMQVIDTLGNTNYTFRITNHPEDSDQIFHNLVYSQIDEEIKLILVKYENFDQDYQFNAFTTFTTYSLISDDPCPENPIPISGGGGGAGSFDPGIPNPGSGGGGGSVGGYTPTPDYSSCWYLMQIPCCHKKHFGEDSSCICNEGEKGYTILFNTCNTSLPPAIIHSGKNTNIDPCNPDGDFGVLYPPVKPPCEVLKEMMDPLKYNAQAYINVLKSMLPNANVEYAFSFKRILDPSTGSYSYPPQQLIAGSFDAVKMPGGVNYYGGIHLHHGKLYNTFSFGDIVNLLDNTNASYSPANGIINDNEAVLMLVSVNPQDVNNPSVKSLTVNDKFALSSKVNEILNDPNWADQSLSRDQKIEVISKQMYSNYGHNHAKFLETFKDFGISMYDYYQPNATSPGTWRKATTAQLNNQPSVLYLPDGYCN